MRQLLASVLCFVLWLTMAVDAVTGDVRRQADMTSDEALPALARGIVEKSAI